jgi:dTDP-4-amino-4,6-dideoxygalactose transaminase
MINVTKPYLPCKNKYKQYVDRIYESNWLTNNGPLVRELEQKLEKYLDVEHLILVSSGSTALQVAYQALGVKGEVITSPFTFIATASTMTWQNLKPVFTDINPTTFNLSAECITPSINENTTAIVPVHVFGNPCEVEEIANIAKENKLKVIYDASHAFGVKYKGQSVLNCGDISTLSFHATKLFHTIEGGAIITKNAKLAAKIRKMINFGFDGAYRHEEQGINAKMNEFEAAMGLCVLDDIDVILVERKKLLSYYRQRLNGYVEFQELSKDSLHNHAYAPVLFQHESELILALEALNQIDVFPRRYFYPSLDTVSYLNSKETCIRSRDISNRILCLPLYVGLPMSEQNMIIDIIKKIIVNNKHDK